MIDRYFQMHLFAQIVIVVFTILLSLVVVYLVSFMVTGGILSAKNAHRKGHKADNDEVR